MYGQSDTPIAELRVHKNRTEIIDTKEGYNIKSVDAKPVCRRTDTDNCIREAPEDTFVVVKSLDSAILTVNSVAG